MERIESVVMKKSRKRTGRNLRANPKRLSRRHLRQLQLRREELLYQNIVKSYEKRAKEFISGMGSTY